MLKNVILIETFFEKAIPENYIALNNALTLIENTSTTDAIKKIYEKDT